MEKNILVIVESPTKAKTIGKFLPKNYRVVASVGHIRDLPQTASEIPAKFKGLPWATLGINIEESFAPLYVVPKEKAALVRELKAELKTCSEILLATDEDREGESISWHLLDVLQPKVPVRRMVFHEITQKAITEALAQPRDIDMNLVNAQETRRLLDRLYGYTLSPLIWKKIAYGLSAGRVQSPGLRLIAERELARCRFVSASYWDLKALLAETPGGKAFEAELTEWKGERIARGRDFLAETGALPPKSSAVLLGENEALQLQKLLTAAPWKVLDQSAKDQVQRPAPPFITSTLQQEANRKLGLSARDAMRLAQKLYEEGFITYMRTDSPTLSTEAIQGARQQIQELYGPEYLSPEPRQYSSKSKSAQESHEAIRPVGARFLSPEATGLSGRERSLYELIWKRTLASQMAEARKRNVTLRLQAGEDSAAAVFTAQGNQILFPGFIRVYVEGRDDPSAALEDKESWLPELKPQQILSLQELLVEGHKTKPPVRYTEAALVQRLEKENIGRPSTYATIINTLLDRGYVLKLEGGSLAPTFTGMAVTGLLEKHFLRLVEYQFTSQMEEDLDEIAAGNIERLSYLKTFYLGEKGLQKTVSTMENLIDPEESRTVQLPQLPPGVQVKVGRFGPYAVFPSPEGAAQNASLPETLTPSELSAETLEQLRRQSSEGPRSLGLEPHTGQPIFALVGRYGPHLQVGEKTAEGPKPRTLSLPKGVSPESVTLEMALKLLSLPRTLGLHPESGKPIQANNGRFGPFVSHDGQFRSLKKTDDVYTVTLERALELLKEEKVPRAGRTIKNVASLKDFGEVQGKPAQMIDGRYGPYIRWGTANVSLPSDFKSPESWEQITPALIETWAKKPKGRPARGRLGKK